MPDDKEWQSLEAAVTRPLPIFDPTNSSVVNPSTGEVIGRISMVRVDTPQFAISVYCRLHQCSCPLRKAATSPDVNTILMWFQEGLDLGKGSQHKKTHLARYKELLNAAQVR